MADRREEQIRYRKSFAVYTEQRLLVSIMFYAASAMLFFGAFVQRYRIELILSFPLVALIMAIYFKLAFQSSSPVEHPEKLYKERGLMAAVVSCSALMVLLLFVNIPALVDMPQQHGPKENSSMRSGYDCRLPGAVFQGDKPRIHRLLFENEGLL